VLAAEHNGGAPRRLILQDSHPELGGEMVCMTVPASRPSRRQRGGTLVRPDAARWAPARWDPFAEIFDLNRQMGRLMEGLAPPSLVGGDLWAPPADIEETEDAWIIEADLPGTRAEDVNIDVEDGELVISGEIVERERRGVLRRRTRRSGAFELRVSVPADIDPDQVKASMDNGVLTVTIPKPERARPRRIEIEQAAPGTSPATEGPGAGAAGASPDG
jgi:HSP20 family protein